MKTSDVFSSPAGGASRGWTHLLNGTDSRVDRLAERVARIERRLEALGTGSSSAAGWVSFLGTPTGYLVGEHDGAPPAPGELVATDDGELRIVRLGPSPFPGDTRRCAYVVRE